MNFRPLSFMRSKFSDACLGVDIGTTSIKIVEVAQGERFPRLVNYALLETKDSLSRSNLAFQTSTLKLFEDEVRDLLRLAIERMNPGTRRASLSLPSFAAFTTVLNFPQMTKEELQKAVEFEARQYIPLPINDVVLDWAQVGTYEDERGFSYEQILIISVAKEQIKKYQKLMADVGLELLELEVEGLALARSLIAGDPTPTLIIDIGNHSTAIVVADQGHLKFLAQSDFGGTSLTQAIAQSLGISPVRAEELKRERGISGTGPDYELSTVMMPFLDAILSEVKRAQFNYQTQFPTASKFERVILSGGGANLIGIEEYVAGQFGVPVAKAAPLLSLEYPPLAEPLIPDLNPLMSVAIGLAIKQFGK